MIFPEDGCLPRITRSGLAPFNNVMIVKVPEQFRKPGETIFQLATLDPGRKTERWPADKFIYKSSVIGEVAVPDSSDNDSFKEKHFEIPKFEAEGQKNLFDLEKKRSKSANEKFSSAVNSDHDKRATSNVKNYKNFQDIKNQTTRIHNGFRKSFTDKTHSDNRSFRNRDYDDDKNPYDARYHHNRNKTMDIHPWICPPVDYANPIININTGYDEPLNMPNNEHTVDLQRQQNKANRFYDGDERSFGHMSGSHLIDRIPVKNLPDISKPDFMAYQELSQKNKNWERPSKPKRGLLDTPIKMKSAPPLNLFDGHSQINHSETGYFEQNRNVPESEMFSAAPRRGRYFEEAFGFENSFNSKYDAVSAFQYGNQYTNISGNKPEYVNDRSYVRNARDEPSFSRSHNKDLNDEMESFRNNDFPAPYPIQGNVSEYNDRRYEQNSGKVSFSRHQEGNSRGSSFKPRYPNKWRGNRGRGYFRGSRPNRYRQRNDRFQKKTANEGENHS